MEEQILRRLKLQNKDDYKRVLALSKQYSRMVLGKQIKREPIEHSYVCIDLALETQGIEINEKEILMKSSGTTKKCYLESKKQYRSILGLKVSSTNLKQIVIKFAPNTSNYMVRKIETLKQTFEERLLRSFPEEKRAFVDFSRSVFSVVAFFLMAKQEKIKVSKSELIEEYDLKQTDFENVVKQMQEMCPDILQVQKGSTTSRKRKNENSNSTPSSKRVKKSLVNEDDEEDLEGGDDENLPSHCINNKALKRKKYEQWKQDSISASVFKLGNSNEQNKSKKKQSMITMFMKPKNNQVEPIEDDNVENNQN